MNIQAKHHNAAHEIAAGNGDVAAAKAAGVTDRTIRNWKDDDDFLSLVDSIRAELDRRTMQRWIAQKHRRVDVLMEQADRIRQLRDSRAEDLDGIPGGSTGLIVRQLKSVGFGENNTLVEEYAFDAALNRELRETLKQAAQELGQWTEKSDITSGNQPLAFTINIDRLQGSDDD